MNHRGKESLTTRTYHRWAPRHYVSALSPPNCFELCCDVYSGTPMSIPWWRADRRAGRRCAVCKLGCRCAGVPMCRCINYQHRNSLRSTHTLYAAYAGVEHRVILVCAAWEVYQTITEAVWQRRDEIVMDSSSHTNGQVLVNNSAANSTFILNESVNSEGIPTRCDAAHLLWCNTHCDWLHTGCDREPSRVRRNYRVYFQYMSPGPHSKLACGISATRLLTSMK